MRPEFRLKPLNSSETIGHRPSCPKCMSSSLLWDPCTEDSVTKRELARIEDGDEVKLITKCINCEHHFLINWVVERVTE